MKESFAQQLLLYRYRYAICYSLIITVGLGTLFFALDAIGPGLHTSEQAQAVSSFNWQWHEWQNGLAIVNLPYILLQKLSLMIFGLHTWSIRLPSVVIGSLTVFLFFLLVRYWFKPHSALATATLFVSSSWLISIARLGVTDIMIPFVYAGLLLSATHLVRHSRPPLLWAAASGIFCALALYTPYGIWTILGLLVIVAIHPQSRRAFRLVSGQQIALGLFFLLPLLLPLGWGLYHDPKQAFLLAGIPEQLPNISAFFKNMGHTALAIVWQAPSMSYLRLGELPLLGIGATALLLGGIFRACQDWRSIRSQFLFCSLAIFFILFGLQPANSSYSLFIVPIYLLITSGVTVLFREWYRLFPRNPYARSFALLPIALLVAVIITYHYQRYFVAWSATPATFQAFNNDIDIVNKAVDQHAKLTLVTTPQQVDFYSIMSTKHPEFSVATTVPAQFATNQSLLITQGIALPPSPQHLRAPETNDDQENSLRFWLILPAN